jgi:diguanylate cyclase (GGDEF)-like protein
MVNVVVAQSADRAVEEGLPRQVLYDALTGLPQRALLDVELSRALERHHSAGEHFAYLLCEIDGLDQITETYGAALADRFVREVAFRLTDAARSDDFIARSSTGQFVVLASRTEASQARHIGRTMTEAVEGAVDLAGSSVWPSVSVGVAATSCVSARAVPWAAGVALQRAQRQGRGAVALFDAKGPPDRGTAQRLADELREAPKTGALRLHYQPIVRMQGNEVAGAEALMRWMHPDHGEVAPGLFIALAEESGLITELGDWALHRACLDAAAWPAGRFASVNISSGQLTAGLVDSVQDALTSSGLRAQRLWLEVTESSLSGDAGDAEDTLGRLAGLGVRICLDDFGAGDRLMSYLRELPFRAVKIDRYFVAGLDKTDDDKAISTALIRLAAGLDLPMIAGGVETVDQLHALRVLGVEYAQGHLWSAALPGEALAPSAAEIEQAAARPALVSPPAAAIPWPGAGVMTRILDLHRMGASPASIAAELNQEDVPSPAGGRWRQVTVAQLVAQSDEPG